MDPGRNSAQTDGIDTCQTMDCEDGCETSETRSLLSVLEVADIARGSVHKHDFVRDNTTQFDLTVCSENLYFDQQ